MADTAQAGKAIPGNEVPAKIKSVGYWHMAWLRYKQNKMAVVGGVFVIFLLIVAIFTPLLAPHPYDVGDQTHAWEGPSLQFPFGTDDNGRDMLSRIMYSVRNALFVAFGAQTVALFLGVALGALAAYRGGILDTIIMRFVDIMFAFPTFLFNVVLVTALGKNLFSIFLAIGLTSWAGLARMVRGQILALKQVEYIEAARALGSTDRHIITRYLLPNVLGTIIISFMMGIPWAMINESGLSILGLGLNPPTPSFGNLLNLGAGNMMGFPHLLLWPAIIFALILLSFNFVGDGLRDAFDPKSEA